MAETPAHDQRTTIHLLEHIPAHEPRESDPSYHLFTESKRRIKAAGLWHCALKPCRYEAGGAQLELHHSKIEFSLQGGVDLAKFNAAYGLHLPDDAAFRAYIESPDGLEVLCAMHHRTHVGVHVLPEPFWQAIRVWKDDSLPPAEVM